MELSPKGRIPIPARLYGLAAVVIAIPVLALVVLPATLGLERYVMGDSAMDNKIPEGSIVLEQRVPHSDVEVGDVITYRPPEGTDRPELITRRVVGVEGGQLTTRADALDTADPWLVSPADYPTLSKMVVAVPWVGGIFAAVGTYIWMAIVAISALGLVLVVWLDRRSHRVGKRLRTSLV